MAEEIAKEESQAEVLSEKDKQITLDNGKINYNKFATESEAEVSFYKSLEGVEPDKLFNYYKMYIASGEENTKQRIESNKFFITVNAALISVFVLMKKENLDLLPLICISFVGIALAVVWLFKLKSYYNMNSIKYHLINLMESKLSVMPYFYEWRALKTKNHIGFSKIEIWIPILFIVAYLLICAIKVYSIYQN